MTEIQVKNSESNVSTGSWTLLDDNSESEDQISVKSVEIEIEDNKNDEEKSSSEGFLVFDEYLQERLLEQSEKKNRKSLKVKKGGRKCKAQNLGIPIFITIILALSAFATLCSTLSQPHIEKDLEKATKIHMKTKPIGEIKHSLKDIEKMKNPKLLDSVDLFGNKQQCPKTAAPFPRRLSDEIEQGFKLLDEIDDILKNTTQQKSKNEFFHKSKIFKTEPKTPKNAKTNWMIFKQLLLDTNVHALFSLVMTNIYLFTLLTDLARKTTNNCNLKDQLKKELLQDLHKHNTPECLKKNLFKELPFHNVEFFKKKKAKTANSDKVTPKSPVKMTILNENKRTDNILFKSCPFLAKKPSIFPLMVLSNEETGKSECQRRFDELDLFDKKFENLKQSQRDRIKLLKQKFKNEVTYIRDTEEESEVRAEKINKTSQRFIKKLKFNREKYLLEMKKMKELRRKVARENVKDVASGSYSVSLSPIYDYGEKFKMIKEKFERENNQLPREWKFQ